jgi:predicted nuclease of restriction endonuclease-like (RecB) superfamily
MKKDKFTIIYEDFMKLLTLENSKVISESYIDDLLKKNQKPQGEIPESYTFIRNEKRKHYKDDIEEVNLVYKNLDELLKPWIDKPFEGLDKIDGYTVTR